MIINKLTQCKNCLSYKYTFDFKIENDIVDFIEKLGNPKYNIEKLKVIRIENDDFVLVGAIGSTTITVKYKNIQSQTKVLKVLKQYEKSKGEINE